jgi:hypothetical protein
MASELEQLRTKITAEERRVESLTSENIGLNVKLKDRAEELKGKSKLLEV